MAGGGERRMTEQAWRFFLGTQNLGIQNLGRRLGRLQVADHHQQIEEVVDANHAWRHVICPW